MFLVFLSSLMLVIAVTSSLANGQTPSVLYLNQKGDSRFNK